MSRKASGEIDFSWRKQAKLQDDRGDQTASTVAQTPNTVCIEPIYQRWSPTDKIGKINFNTIGTSGTVTVVAGDVIHGDVKIYSADCAKGVSMKRYVQQSR